MGINEEGAVQGVAGAGMSDIDEIDFGAILSAPPARAGSSLSGRRAADRKKLSDADRRKIQTTGRTEQMNIRTRPMTKLEFTQHAASKGLLPTELFETVWEFYKAADYGAAGSNSKNRK